MQEREVALRPINPGNTNPSTSNLITAWTRTMETSPLRQWGEVQLRVPSGVSFAGIFAALRFRRDDTGDHFPAARCGAPFRDRCMEAGTQLDRKEEADSEMWEEQRRELHRRLAIYEDAGHGECHLRRPDFAAMVERVLRHFNGLRYSLIAWCVMPSHVHTLIRTHVDWPVGHVVQSREAPQRPRGQPAAWRERRVLGAGLLLRLHPRRSALLARCASHFHQNPVKAGLCRTAGDWEWQQCRRTEREVALRPTYKPRLRPRTEEAKRMGEVQLRVPLFHPLDRKSRESDAPVIVGFEEAPTVPSANRVRTL